MVGSRCGSVLEGGGSVCRRWECGGGGVGKVRVIVYRWEVGFCVKWIIVGVVCTCTAHHITL